MRSRRALAKELGPRKIRINAINPGGIETEGFHAMGMPGSDFEKQMIAQTPLGRIGQPNDVAPVVAFLASSDAELGSPAKPYWSPAGCVSAGYNEQQFYRHHRAVRRCDAHCSRSTMRIQSG